MKTILALIAAAGLVSCAGTATTTGVKPYTSDTCAVTQNKLGSMGRVITKVHGDQQVKFCCQPCVVKFEKDPQRYLKNI